jgi:hypothetical protein
MHFLFGFTGVYHRIGLSGYQANCEIAQRTTIAGSARSRWSAKWDANGQRRLLSTGGRDPLEVDAWSPDLFGNWDPVRRLRAQNNLPLSHPVFQSRPNFLKIPARLLGRFRRKG